MTACCMDAAPHRLLGEHGLELAQPGRLPRPVHGARHRRHRRPRRRLLCARARRDGERLAAQEERAADPPARAARRDLDPVGVDPARALRRAHRCLRGGLALGRAGSPTRTVAALQRDVRGVQAFLALYVVREHLHGRSRSSTTTASRTPASPDYSFHVGDAVCLAAIDGQWLSMLSQDDTSTREEARGALRLAGHVPRAGRRAAGGDAVCRSAPTLRCSRRTRASPSIRSPSVA